MASTEQRLLPPSRAESVSRVTDLAKSSEKKKIFLTIFSLSLVTETRPVLP